MNLNLADCIGLSVSCGTVCFCSWQKLSLDNRKHLSVFKLWRSSKAVEWSTSAFPCPLSFPIVVTTPILYLQKVRHLPIASLLGESSPQLQKYKISDHGQQWPVVSSVSSTFISSRTPRIQPSYSGKGIRFACFLLRELKSHQYHVGSPSVKKVYVYSVIPGSGCEGTEQLSMVTLMIAEISKAIWDGGKLRWLCYSAWLKSREL